MADRKIVIRTKVLKPAPQASPPNEHDAQQIPAVKARPKFPHLESFKDSLSVSGRDKQLELLERLAFLPTPDYFAVGGTKREKHMRGEIAAVRKEFLEKTGSHLRTRQLLVHALTATCAAHAAQAHSEPVWSQTERSTFKSIRKEPLERQRGRLSALHIHELSELARQLPEVIADALYCLMVESKPRTLHAQRLLNQLDKRMHYLEERDEAYLSFSDHRLIELGNNLLQAMLANQYPDPAMQESAMQAIVDSGQRNDFVLKACSEALRMKREGTPLPGQMSLWTDELECLQEAVEQCDPEKRKGEMDSLAEQLQNMLLKQLPLATQKTLKALGKAIAEDDNQGKWLEIRTLLYRPQTAPQDLVDTLKSDADRLAALRILRGGPLRTCLGFARQLSEMLRFAEGDAAQLLGDLRDLLMAQLGPEKAGTTLTLDRPEHIVSRVEALYRPLTS